eukprot:5938200-Pyramimonas_sp.AAC.1
MPTRERRHWGLRWNYSWSHEACEGCTANRRCANMRASPLGSSVGPPSAATKRVRCVCVCDETGVTTACECRHYGNR